MGGGGGVVCVCVCVCACVRGGEYPVISPPGSLATNHLTTKFSYIVPFGGGQMVKKKW